VYEASSFWGGGGGLLRGQTSAFGGAIAPHSHPFEPPLMQYRRQNGGPGAQAPFPPRIAEM